MITEEERAKLKVGYVVYYVHELDKDMYEYSIDDIQNNTVYLGGGYCDIDDTQLFNRKVDALKELKTILTDEVDELESKIRSLDDRIEQLEQENG